MSLDGSGPRYPVVTSWGVHDTLVARIPSLKRETWHPSRFSCDCGLFKRKVYPSRTFSIPSNNLWFFAVDFELIFLKIAWMAKALVRG